MREGVTAPETWRQEEILRRKRRLATTYRRRRIRLAVAFGIVCLLVAGILIAVYAGGTTEQVNTQNLLIGDASSASAPVSATGEARPAFARLGDRNLLLPVAAGDATIIAYQPVSDERAVPLDPLGDQANSNALVRFFRGIFSGEPLVRYYLIDGEGGETTGSVLIGAPAGSPVTAPVSGVVTAVKEYKLYGKYDDVRIDIRPEELSGDTISLMFISDPVVSIGEVVTAGKTQLGKVRECPSELGATLAQYTHDSGSHVNMIVTEEPID
jgi:murein DD-endopeptidase MepM/ murein hydrolase activator NlpD